MTNTCKIAYTDEYDIDYYGKPKKNERVAGLLPEEKDNFTKYIESGFIDTFRYKYPDKDDGFTWWTPLFKQARILNNGWRIDYALVSDNIESNIIDSIILKDVMGSDHCPILLEMSF